MRVSTVASGKLPFGDRHGDEQATIVVAGCRILLMRSPDILALMRMADDIATALYWTGLDPFTK
jgi:hypothetical protein